MESKILVTLGPASLRSNIIKQMTREGIYVFRINLSHTEINDIEDSIKKIKSFTNIPVCLDSEGAQIRTRSMENGEVLYREQNIV